MSEFNSTNWTVTDCLECFLLFTAANNTMDAQNVPTLLTVIGASNYTLIRGLVSPDLPKDTCGARRETFRSTTDCDHWTLSFYKSDQKAGESLRTYLAQLCKLASRCEFGAFLSEALRDCFICGMLQKIIQKVILMKAKLDLDKALKISLGMEAAAL